MAHQVITPKLYTAILFALLVLTGLTIGVSRIDLGTSFHLVFGLCIAIVKAGLVVLFFMHAWYSSKLTWVVAASGIVFLLILIAFTLSDYLTRKPNDAQVSHENRPVRTSGRI